jgi:Domain of unknown function (DUF4168)
MMQRRVWLLTAAALVAAVPVSNAQAQSQTPPSVAPSPSEPAQNIPEQKLDAAAAALNEIATLKDAYQQRIDSADPAEKSRLAQEANGALLKAITDQGLSVEEYTRILVVAQNDPTVRDKIIQRLRPPQKQ